MQSWATQTDVEDVTGRVVSDATIMQAQHLIELVTDREFGDPLPTARDTRVLRLAVCYQAVHIADNPDLFSRDDTAQEELGDMRVQHRDSPSRIVLAPLTQVALRRLSWRVNQSTKLVSQPRADRDDLLNWRSL